MLWKQGAGEQPAQKAASPAVRKAEGDVLVQHLSQCISHLQRLPHERPGGVGVQCAHVLPHVSEAASWHAGALRLVYACAR